MSVPPSAVIAAIQAEQARMAQQRASIMQQQAHARASLVGNNSASAAAAAAVALQEQQAQAAARAAFMMNPASNNNPTFFLQQLQQQQQLAAALAQMNAASSMVATAKLANSKLNDKKSNSSVVVRSSVPKLTNAGGVYTVAQWARKCVEDNLEFIVKLCRRSDPKATAVILTYGDAGETQTLVLFDDHINKSPTDMKKIPMVGVGVSSSYADDKRDETKMAAGGVLQATDSIWEHLRYDQMVLESTSNAAGGRSGGANKKDETSSAAKGKGPNVMFLHTQLVTGQFFGFGASRRVLQVKTEASNGKPYVASSFCPNPAFEQQVLELWAAQAGGSVRPAMPLLPIGGGVGVAAGMSVPAGPQVSGTTGANADDDDDYDTLIDFNPRELMILERAFDGRLRKQDLKQSVKKFNDKDKEECQEVIRRANSEFKYVLVRGSKTKKKDGKKRKSPSSQTLPQPVEEKKDEAPKPSPAKKKKTEPKTKPNEEKKDVPKTPAKTKKEVSDSEKKTPAAKSTIMKDEAPASKSTTKKKGTSTISTINDAKKKSSPSKTSGGKNMKSETPAKKTTKKSPSPVKKQPANAKTPVTKASQKKTGTPASSPKSKSATKAKTAVKAKQTPKKAASPGSRRGLRLAPPAKKTRSRSRSKSRK